MSIWPSACDMRLPSPSSRHTTHIGATITARRPPCAHTIGCVSPVETRSLPRLGAFKSNVKVEYMRMYSKSSSRDSTVIKVRLSPATASSGDFSATACTAPSHGPRVPNTGAVLAGPVPVRHERTQTAAHRLSAPTSCSTAEESAQRALVCSCGGWRAPALASAPPSPRERRRRAPQRVAASIRMGRTRGGQGGAIFHAAHGRDGCCHRFS